MSETPADAPRPTGFWAIATLHPDRETLVAPDGSDLARAGRGEELILADIDPASMAESRRLNTYLADRRPELYGTLVTRREEGKA